MLKSFSTMKIISFWFKPQMTKLDCFYISTGDRSCSTTRDNSQTCQNERLLLWKFRMLGAKYNKRGNSYSTYNKNILFVAIFDTRFSTKYIYQHNWIFFLYRICQRNVYRLLFKIIIFVMERHQAQKTLQLKPRSRNSTNISLARCTALDKSTLSLQRQFLPSFYQNWLPKVSF